MTAQIIDGKAVAQGIKDRIAAETAKLKEHKIEIGLAVILVGEDPASAVYVRNKIKACGQTGIKSFEHKLPEDTDRKTVAALIEKLNSDNDVHGILLQLPLPDHLAPVQEDLVQMINPDKDVDGLTVTNAGRLLTGLDGLVPCTPQGSMILIKTVQEELSGAHAVVIGRSNLFGKPMGQLLLRENCTLTQCHSRTKDLPGICAQADILVAAVGRAEMVKADWVKDGAIVIDVGINRNEDGKLIGDVDFAAVREKARAITPVPGGVGPMTIACLLRNTLKAGTA